MNFNLKKKDYRGNLFSQLFFTWLETFFFKGFRSKLKQSDLFPCPNEQCSQKLYETFDKYWKYEVEKKRNPDIKIALAKTCKLFLCVSSTCRIAVGLLLIIQAILVFYFSALDSENFFNIQTNHTFVQPVCIATFISLNMVSIAVINSNSSYIALCIGLQMRAICTTAIFKKTLKMQQTLLHKTSIGHIINLVSNDVFKLDFGLYVWDWFWISPIIAVVCLFVVLIYIGPIGLIGVGYIILHTPLQVFLGYIFGYLRFHQSKTADIRIRLMDQIIRGMRVIKFYAWEIPFVKYISKIRRKEIAYASMSGIAQSSYFTFFSTSLFIGLFLIYVVSYQIGDPLNTSQLSAAFLLFHVLRTYMILFMGQSIFSMRKSVIALKRIQRILEFPVGDNQKLLKSCISRKGNNTIQLKNFTAFWDGTGESESRSKVLKSISFNLFQPQLAVITGPIGSGKSSLLLSLIRELPGISGDISTRGVLSYAAQEPWIFSGTIRDNILIGNPFLSARYSQVIEACCLREDLSSFDKRDETLIGERGITLSGGQKARVALARSVYHQADIYLFDDPLSAVDVKVGQKIFQKCIKEFLKEKLVLVVTHQIQYAMKADQVLVLNEGRLESSGSYQHVMQNGFCKGFLQTLEINDETEYVDTEVTFGKCPNNKHNNPMDQEYGNQTSEDITYLSNENMNEQQPLTTSLSEEEHATTSFTLITYIRYFWDGGFLPTISMLLLTILSNGGIILSYWWIQSTTRCFQNRNLTLDGNNMTNSTLTQCPWYYNIHNSGSLKLVALFTFSGFAFMFLRGFNFYYIVLQASKRLHQRMLRTVLYTPIHFFDTNPSGRILNRFSKDFGFLDEQLPMLFYDFWQYSTYCIGIVIASSLVQYYLLLPFSVLVLCTLGFRYWYLKTCSQVKRLESIARSPLYSHISLTLQGLTTIRSLSLESRLTKDFHYFLDEHSRAWYHYLACSRWFGIRIDFLSVFVVIFGIFSAIIAKNFLGSNDLIEFSIPLILSLPIQLQTVVRTSGDVDILMVSVDRILKYCKLKQENSQKRHECKQNSVSLLKGTNGRIQFNRVCFKYSKDLPYSLIDVSLDIRPGEKVGIIGRTGAGKSSLFSSLFLLNGISAGRIMVDNEDISSLNLFQHRKRLSIIPQDPFLFTGTLRYNLDPFEEFGSEEIWDALTKSHLCNMVQSLPDQLMTSVAEDGHNFSAGERQLLCLARAILRKNKIILIDEATANVDLQTDALVQQAIRSHFSDCSVLTIAHRIETIIDSDRIVVLERGRIIEIDVPFLMLGRENSYLSHLLSHLDPRNEAQLRNAARMSYFN